MTKPREKTREELTAEIEDGKKKIRQFENREKMLRHIRTHNTDLKKRLTAYAGQYPDECRQTDTDPETGCMEFEVAKRRFSFRLTAPYSEERRRAASEAAKAHSNNLLRAVPKV